MKNSILVLAMCTIAALTSSCSKDMGSVVFKNRSVDNHTYNVVWDGSVIVSLYPQMDSDTFDVASGPHTCVFEISNNGEQACDQGNPKIAEGQTQAFTCSY